MPSDARRYAAALLKQLQQTHLKDSFCCYGTQQSVLLGIGRDSSLKLTETDSLDAVWSGINSYIEDNADDYIFGFIGFDPANQLSKKIEDYQQKIDLFVPNIVIECHDAGCTLLKGNAETDLASEASPTDNASPIHISELDRKELRNRYAESVAHFIEAIHAGSLERATLARKINTSCDFDLALTFVSDQSRHEFARSFYFSNANISFAGQCPELLAEGNTTSFATHKLSGTYSKDDKLSIEELTARFRNDQRIISEHQSSMSSIEDSLTDIGSVQSTKFQVMELPTLLHGWSKFVTRPTESATVANCLRSIFPFGVNPMQQGFKLLARHEDFCRGPYYGLIGCIRPGGEFSFTQVLRSAYIDNESSYLMVGAAITSLSTPELEAEETCSKLFGVQIFNASIPKQDKAK